MSAGGHGQPYGALVCLLAGLGIATALADEISTLYEEWGKLAEAMGTTAG